MTDLAQLSFGRVKGRFMAGVADGDDAGDAPDVQPLEGSVVFTPGVEVIRVPTATPDPVTVLMRPITVLLDSDGYLAASGSRLISLVATDDPDGIPVGWTWAAVFKLRYRGRSVVRPSFSFSLPSGSTIDLTTVAAAAIP